MISTLVIASQMSRRKTLQHLRHDVQEFGANAKKTFLSKTPCHPLDVGANPGLKLFRLNYILCLFEIGKRVKF